jgi:enoyl-CoA hydratase/carnithine racemase
LRLNGGPNKKRQEAVKQTVVIQRAGAVCTLLLNRPEKLNAVNIELAEALDRAIAAVSADASIRVVIIRGAGRAFCAGNDLDATSGAAANGFDRALIEAHARDLQSITRRVLESEKVFIAAVHGWAVGAGFEWALNCDLSVWGETAHAFFPEVRLGMFPTGGVTALLPRIVGANRAREMLLLGDRYSSSDLQRFGLATRVVPDSSVIETAECEARRICEFPPAAVAMLKKALVRAATLSLDDVLDFEVECLVGAAMQSQQKLFGGDDG